MLIIIVRNPGRSACEVKIGGSRAPCNNEVVAREYREREDKYDVDAAFVLPDLQAAVPRGGSLDTVAHRLSSVYFDTQTHDLRRNGLILRRRSGSTDTGWQLKMPSGPARTELSVDLTDDDVVPGELAALLHGVRRARQLAPIARLDVERTVHRVIDQAGALVAEVADDAVHATAIGSAPHSVADSTARVTQWREVEVEWGPAGSEDALAGIATLLRQAGAAPSARASKLELALGALPVAVPITPDSTLGDAVSAYVNQQIEAIVAGDLGLRRHVDVVHPTRVAIRRLRSTVRTFAPVFDEAAAAEMETDLVWLAGLLGGVRDADVLRQRLHGLVEAVPPEYVLGPIAARIDSDLLAERSQHAAVLHEQLDSPRMLALLDRLEQWRLAAPLTPAAEHPASAAKAYLKKARRTLQRRLARAIDLHARMTRDAADDDPASLAHAGLVHHEDDLVHSARKAGKRFRYAAELSTPLLGPKAREHAKRGEHLQNLLGEHQDIVVSASALRRLGATAGSTPGENGFTFGLLLARELARGDEIREELALVAL